MEFKYVNCPKEIAKVGDQVRTAAGFVGRIEEFKDDVAYIRIPTYYGPGGILVTADATRLVKYM